MTFEARCAAARGRPHRPRTTAPGRLPGNIDGADGAAEKNMANKDQAEGEAKRTGGKIQEKAGEITGDRETQAEGQKHQVEGGAQKTKGDIKESVNDVVDSITKD